MEEERGNITGVGKREKEREREREITANGQTKKSPQKISFTFRAVCICTVFPREASTPHHPCQAHSFSPPALSAAEAAARLAEPTDSEEPDRAAADRRCMRRW